MAYLPNRLPMGLNPDNGRLEVVERFDAGEGPFRPHAVAAILPPGFVRQRLPAVTGSSEAPALPLRSYTAVGFQDDSVVVAASRQDDRRHWDPARFQVADLDARIERMSKRFPKNAVIRQIAHCARFYFCCTARNVFLESFEGALPCAPRCNARCLACISQQPAGQAPSPQQRLQHPPPAAHLIQVGVHHLERAQPGMVSFGQGCEGEPLTQAELIAEAIAGIRQHTSRGTIHMNTNGSRPGALGQLVDAGLQSVRVSLFSARPEHYQAYHQGHYKLDEVEAFTRQATASGCHASLNLLVFPGFTDRRSELEALLRFIEQSGAHMVQLRNLDVDPDRFVRQIQPPADAPLGVERFIQLLKEALPDLDIGCFNRFGHEWGAGR
jgi:hypothetical protein